jgi:uncharacterized repeat protein (TIGR01451 family)
MRLLTLILIFYSFVSKAQFGSRLIVSNLTDGAVSVCFADLDSDGDLDVLSASFNDDKIAWYENLGAGLFGGQQIINSSADMVTSMATGDFNNDGLIDLVFSSSSGFNYIVAWHENLGGGSFAGQQIITSDVIWPKIVITADLNNDGKIDVLSGSAGDDKVAWYENLGNGLFGGQQHINNPDLDGQINNGIEGDADYVSDVFAIDLDNDGDFDVISASRNDTKLAWYENLGLGLFGNQQIVDTTIYVYDNGRGIYSSDIDNDGYNDILTIKIGKIIWFKNLGNSSFSPPQIIDSTMFPNTVYITDVDKDGLSDIISSNNASGGPQLYWLKNAGNGVFDVPKVVFTNTTQSGISWITSADLDNDNDDDILFASYNGDKVSWINNFYPNPKLNGTIFYDSNQNGLLDINEFGLAFIQSQLIPNNIYSYSIYNGSFNFIIDTGSYVLSYSPINLWNLSTDSVSYNVSLSVASQVIDSLNFGFYPDTILSIIYPDLTGSFPRCNTITNYCLTIENKGTTIPKVNIHLQLDDSISFVSASITPDSVIGQDIYWHYDSLFFFSSEIINLQVQLPDINSVGDTLTSYLTVNQLDSLGGNSIIYSNIDTLKQVLVCAYDPNDKSVNPIGIGSEGYISNNQELEYLIRFQNTGNDTALNVMIRDQLDSNLNWSTMQPITSSHPVQVWIEEDGEAVFKFENINLPDSGADFLGSQGFVKFKITPDTGLTPNTTIFNTAHIYFDFNSAVITNTILNTIDTVGSLVSTNEIEFTESNDIIAFPNPLRENLTIYYKSKIDNPYNLMLFDITGKEVYRKENITSNKTTINLNQLNNGLYIVVGIDISGKQLFSERVVVQ